MTRAALAAVRAWLSTRWRDDPLTFLAWAFIVFYTIYWTTRSLAS